MEKQTNTVPKVLPQSVYVIAYLAFVITGAYTWFFTSNQSMAVSYLGLALIFDPFKQDVPWGKRPLYQRAILVVHLILALSAFIVMITNK